MLPQSTIPTSSRASNFQSRLSGVFLLFAGRCATSDSDVRCACEFLRILPGWVSLHEHFWHGTALSSCARPGMVYFMSRRSPQAGLAPSVDCTWTLRRKLSSPMPWHPCRCTGIEGKEEGHGQYHTRGQPRSRNRDPGIELDTVALEHFRSTRIPRLYKGMVRLTPLCGRRYLWCARSVRKTFMNCGNRFVS
jgi:hypothetical protein